MFWISFDWDFVSGARPLVRKTCWKPRRPLTDAAIEKGLKRLSWVQKVLNKVNFQRVILRDEHHEILPFLKSRDRVWDIDYHWDIYNCFIEPDCANWVRHANVRNAKVTSITERGYNWDWEYDHIAELKLRVPKTGNLFISWSADYSDSLWDGILLEFLKQFPQVDFYVGGKNGEMWFPQQWLSEREEVRPPMCPVHAVSINKFRRTPNESVRSSSS